MSFPSFLLSTSSCFSFCNKLITMFSTNSHRLANTCLFIHLFISIIFYTPGIMILTKFNLHYIRNLSCKSQKFWPSGS
jgi:hypothetical protein